MKADKEAKISYWAAHLTTIISVTLVLLLIGIIALVSLAAAGETKRLKERIELCVVLNDSVSDNAAQKLVSYIQERPYSKDVTLVTRQQALANWKADTGEDLEALFGVNPLSPEIDFTVKADYASPKSINSISAQLKKLDNVSEVSAPDTEMVEQMNHNIGNLSLILSAIAIVMIVISFVLINNTVHLTIYSRRFSIHTMQLVGATAGFIRRPFILNNILSGVIAGAVAAAIIAVALALAPSAGMETQTEYINWAYFGIIAAGLVITGALICGVAAWIATARYLHKDYDQLFK